MSLLSANRVKFSRAAMLFEQLEERIVLDASVDQTPHENAVGACPHLPVLPPPLPFAAPFSAVPDPGATVAQAQELNVVLIADNLPQKEILHAAAQDHSQVLFYDASSNLNSINTALKQLVADSGHKIDHLAVVGHAELGKAWLGAEKVDVLSAQSHRSDFEALGQVLADNAQVQLYGCSIAGNALGEALVDRIALYSHADVFASANKTGGSQHDWVLEYASNPDQKMLPILQADALMDYTAELFADAQWVADINVQPPGWTGIFLPNRFQVAQIAPIPPAPATIDATVYVLPVDGGFTSISALSVAGATVSQVSDTQINITADTPDAINSVLGTLSGTIQAGYIGPLGLGFAAADENGGDTAVPDSLGSVEGSNDIPVITVPVSTQNVPANTLTIVSGITVSDLDAPNFVGLGELRVTITAADATAQLQVPTNLLTSAAGLGTNSIIIEGLQQNLNTTLQSLRYFNSTPGPDTLTVVVNDLGHTPAPAQEAQATVNINVASAFQDFTPSIGGVGVGPFAIAGGAPQTLQTIDGATLITVSDPNSHNIDVGIHCNHGTLALPSPLATQITVTGADPSNRWVQFRGPLDYVQDTVRATTYTAPTHYTGQDFIYIIANDGNSSDYRNPVNRPTQLTMPLNVANP
ncbi:MAG: DUF4347 domain-containing protein [Desulfomonile tiedjei]|nr:DUF4347 domain-containing protein [Desulfomonile tiedjei]